MKWSLDHAYDEYPRIEDEFGAALDRSLDPRGPDHLFDIVAGLDLVPGSVAADVGCGEGAHAVACGAADNARSARVAGPSRAAKYGV